MIDRHANQASMIESDITVIRAELDRLLNERRFSGAPQMSAFLRYIVNETLDGNADRIKAFSVGVDALGKPDTFDAQTDPSVRVLALRLRKTLDAIYQDKSCSFAIISLRVGTYVPTFLKVGGEQPSELSNSDHVEKQPSLGYQSVAEGLCDAPSEQQESNTKRGSFVMSDPSDRSAASGPIKLSTETTASGGSVTNNRPYNIWLVMFGAVLLVSVWQSGVKQADAQASLPGNSVAEVASGSENSATVMGVIGSAVVGPSGLPTIVVRSVSDAVDVERRAALILTAKFIQSDALKVIKADNSVPARDYGASEYQLYVNSFVVADEVRLNTQLISSQQGEMLFSTTVTLSHLSNRFSAEDVDIVESLALRLSSKQGPLFKHYCALQSSISVDTCTTT